MQVLSSFSFQIMFNNIFLALFGTLLFATSTSLANNKVQVVTKLGPISGEVINPIDIPINQFLGIPYAKPPVGSLRFRRPAPLDDSQKWTQPLEATSWPPQCVQNKMFTQLFAPMTLNSNFSEDCLYLNVWSPNVEVTDESKLKPVLVWIHGGKYY